MSTSTTAAKASGITPSTASAHIVTTPHQDSFLKEPASVPATTTATTRQAEPSISAAPGSRPPVPTQSGTISQPDMSITDLEDSTPMLLDASSNQPTPTTKASAPEPGPTSTTSPSFSSTSSQSSDPPAPQPASHPTTQQTPYIPQATVTATATTSSSFQPPPPPQTSMSLPEPTYRGQPVSSTTTSSGSTPSYYQQQFSSGTDVADGPGYYQQQSNISREVHYPEGGEGKRDPGILGTLGKVVDSVNEWMVGEKGHKDSSA